MTKRIFKAVCAAALSVFLVTMLLIMGVLYNYFSSMQQNQLRAQTLLAVQGVEQQGMAFFDGLDADNFRITWIAANGEVLYDSVSDSDTMENHLEREEIRQALSDGIGQSSRYSSTLMKQYLYCAQRLSDGTVLRLSVSHNTIIVLLLGMLQPILIVIAVALVLSFLLASRLSKRIVEPMNRLNLDEPLENEGYDELSPLLRRIYSQQQSLKKQKAILTRKQNELDAIVSHLEEGMLLLDRDCRVITANEAALKLMDVKNKNVAGLSLLSLNRNMELQEAVNQALSGVTVTKKTGIHGRTIQLHAASVGKEQELSGVAVVLFDITQLEQAEQRRREFTANVSHELKTPLQSISGYSELMKCGLTKPEDVQPFAERIYLETQRLIHLVEDIINLSHLDEEKGYEPTRMDLFETAREVTADLQSVAAEKQVTLTLEGSGAEITGVAELARGIVYNLCDNAIKYNKPQGSVTVSVQKKEDGVLLTVKDTGIGIPEEEQDRIFERFYRVDKSHSREVGGTGLGLSIVKHSAMLMGGKINLESCLNQGTTITVFFPK